MTVSYRACSASTSILELYVLHGFLDLERQVQEVQQTSAARRNEQAVTSGQRVAFGQAGGYDNDLYGDTETVTSGYFSALGAAEEPDVSFLL